jgi:hypothetical protein
MLDEIHQFITPAIVLFITSETSHPAALYEASSGMRRRG